MNKHAQVLRVAAESALDEIDRQEARIATLERAMRTCARYLSAVNSGSHQGFNAACEAVEGCFPGLSVHRVAAQETAVATEPKFYKLKCHTCEKEFYSAMPASIGVAHCSRECAV